MNKKVKEFIKEVCSSKEKAIAFLYKAGICTKTGKLRKIYATNA